MTYDLNPYTSGSVKTGVNGTTGYTLNYQTTAYAQVVTAGASGGFIFTPASLTGTIANVSIQLLTPATATLTVKDSLGNPTFQIYNGGDSNNNTFLGLSSGESNTSGNGNTATGALALQNNTTGSLNTALGYEALTSNTSGGSNTAVGAEALISATTGSSNTALGQAALYDNTTGGYNTAVGQSALASNVNGNYDTAIGQGSLFANISGSSNTAIGQSALNEDITGSTNLAIGGNALQYDISGSNNVAIGASGLQHTTGGNNVAIGSYSLTKNTSGSNNIGIGNNSQVSASGLQNASALGASSLVGSNNTIALGGVNGFNSATANDSVVIGTISSINGNILSVAPQVYNTGTASQTSGSGVITGTGTTWTSAMVGDQITFADGNTETITAFTSATSITGSSTTISESGSKYSISAPGLEVGSLGQVGFGTVSPNSNTQVSIQGAGSDSSTSALNVTNSSSVSLLNLSDNGNFNIGATQGTNVLGTVYSPGGNQDNGNSNHMNAVEFATGSSPAYITTLEATVGTNVEASPNNQYQMAIYTNSSGNPGTLVAETAVGTLTANTTNTLSLVPTVKAAVLEPLL